MISLSRRNHDGERPRRPAADRAEGEPAPDAGRKPDYQPPPKKSDPLPKPGDAYRAMCPLSQPAERRAAADSLRRLRIAVCEGFAYSDLRRLRWLSAGDAGGGPVIELRFVEAVITECGSRGGIWRTSITGSARAHALGMGTAERL